MPTVFVLSKFREGTAKTREDYERWVREYDYPNSKGFQAIQHYRTYRVTTDLAGDKAPYDYIEHIDISNIPDYQADLATPAGAELLRQWSEFVDGVGVFSDVIE